jgi:hypothetical protein
LSRRPEKKKQDRSDDAKHYNRSGKRQARRDTEGLRSCQTIGYENNMHALSPYRFTPMQKSLDDFLEAPDGAGKVLAHARLLLRLTRLYQAIAPAHLAAASHLANCKSGIVVIHASSGAVATKLKQLAPTLADGFSKRGIECNGVQVKVQAREIGTQSSTSEPRPLSPNTEKTLGSLRDGLPNSPLRKALDALLAHALKAE